MNRFAVDCARSQFLGQRSVFSANEDQLRIVEQAVDFEHHFRPLSAE